MSPAPSLIALLLSFVAAGLLYLASTHRRWGRAVPRRIFACVGAPMLVVALAVWVATLGPIAGVFAASTAVMLAWVALPYAGALRGGG